MNQIKFLSTVLWGVSLLTSCSTNTDPAVTTTASIKMSAVTTNGKTSIGGRVASSGSRIDSVAIINLTDVKVNVRDIHFDFDHEDHHFKKDSAYTENDDAKLKGPFIVDLLNSGSFVDQVVTSVNIPNAKYEKVSLKLVSSTESGDMNGKSILISGTIGTIPFIFWHNERVRFGAKFQDSTALSTSGGAVTLAIHLELDKIMAVANGGVDLRNAKDGNNDGTITIDPLNDDGNKELADQLMELLTRHVDCEKRKD